MRKVLTLSEEQLATIGTAMADLSITSHSQAFATLAALYNQNKRRPPGRPKGEDTSAQEEEDDMQKWVHPNKHTKGPYSYNEIAAYNDLNKLGTPDRSKLVIHPEYKP